MFRDKKNFEDSTSSPKILLFKNFGTYFFMNTYAKNGRGPLDWTSMIFGKIKLTKNIKYFMNNSYLGNIGAKDREP